MSHSFSVSLTENIYSRFSKYWGIISPTALYTEGKMTHVKLRWAIFFFPLFDPNVALGILGFQCWKFFCCSSRQDFRVIVCLSYKKKIVLDFGNLVTRSIQTYNQEYRDLLFLLEQSKIKLRNLLKFKIYNRYND